MGASHQALLMAGGSSFTGAMDSYTSNLWSLCGIKRWLSSYTGPLLRVRRSSDNTEQDVGYLSDGTLDTSSLSSFVGSNSAFVTKWYDQSGSGNDFIQATSGRQPRIVNAGTYDGKLVFNPSGTDDFMSTTATGGATTAKTIIRRANLTSGANGTNIEWEYGDGGAIGGAGGKQMQLNYVPSAGRHYFYMGANSGSGYYEVQYSTSSHGAANTFVGIVSASASGSSKMFMDGIPEGQVGAINPGGGTFSGTFPAYVWTIGARASSASLGTPLEMWNCAIYDADKSTDALAINAILEA